MPLSREELRELVTTMEPKDIRKLALTWSEDPTLPDGLFDRVASRATEAQLAAAQDARAAAEVAFRAAKGGDGFLVLPAANAIWEAALALETLSTIQPDEFELLIAPLDSVIYGGRLKRAGLAFLDLIAEGRARGHCLAERVASFSPSSTDEILFG